MLHPPDSAAADPHTPYRRAYLVLVAVSLPLILLLPPPAPLVILAALALVLAAVLADDRQALAKIVHLDLPQIATPARLYLIEIALVLVVLALATRGLQNFSPLQRLSGNEFSYLINSGVIAADGYQQTGAITLWNPYMGRGEPLVENPFSFVLNPLMTLPIFWFGAIQGTKVAVLLHIGLMGVGGWLLGWVIGMKTPGRLLLALLLGGAGSFVAPLGMGFYQMSLSQSYVPSVYAGMLGILTRPKSRLWTALFVVAGALLIFAGTFWYVLPTALGCGLLVVFHAVRRAPGSSRFSVDTALLMRVAFAGLLLAGLAAVRLLPQAVHHDLIEHPLEYFDDPPASLFTVFLTLVTPTVVPPFVIPALHYHYLIPLGFAALLVFGRLALTALRVPVETHWRVVIPALLMIVLCLLWAQGDTFTRWLYDTIPLLREWRFVGRMIAAAAPWVAVLAALWLDEIVGVLWRALTIPGTALTRRWQASPHLMAITTSALLLFVLWVSAQSANDILSNWRSHTSTESNGFLERAPLAYLREQNPGAFLAVATSSFFGYIPFYESHIRATFGNPDYHPLPLAPTIGTTSAMDFPPPDALGLSSIEFHDYLRGVGYEAQPGIDGLFGSNVLWHNPTAPPYAFTVSEAVLYDRRARLDTYLTNPVDFVHKLDTIEVFPADDEASSVLVAQEVAYPGWQVSIDGEPAQIESVGGLIGVRLPSNASDTPLHVVFAYRPAWLYLGTAVTLFSLGILLAYALRVERRFRRSGGLPG